MKLPDGFVILLFKSSRKCNRRDDGKRPADAGHVAEVLS
jgi:hypothetical protein